MSKIGILLAALPAVSIGLGYGVGTSLSAPVAADPGYEVSKRIAPARSEPSHESVISGAEAATSEAEEPQKDSKDIGATEEPDMNHLAVKSAQQTVSNQLAMETHETESAIKALNSKDVVKLGRVIVPVHRPSSITYVVADLGVAMPDSETAAEYRIGENAVRLRDAIMMSLHKASESPKMKRANLDSEWLSQTLLEGAKEEVSAVEDILFLKLYKKDVPQS